MSRHAKGHHGIGGWLATGAVLLTVSTGVLPPAAMGAVSAPDQTSAAVSQQQAHVVRETWIDERTVDLVIHSPALGAEAPVRLLVPEGWSRESARTWPVLYLLHGCCEPLDYRSWTELGNAAPFLADKDVLTVMPSGGPAGFYTKWWNYGRPGGPDWEAFHLDELRGILERDYGAGTRRAVAGLSIGGYGAMSYAERRPGMFAAAASYSGMLHTQQPSVPELVFGMLNRVGEDPMRMWGDPRMQVELWSERNPYEHTETLRGTSLYISSGNGFPGPLDPPGSFGDLLEPAAQAVSRAFTDRLRQQGIEVATNFYGNGTHSWPYWERELQTSWPVLAAGLGIS
ncbi:alpha/beta hydrolase family protein [Saccharopolyspora taberi]|uniref:Alpha/beta hydrolase family protein n=1 Tax=Saccharopolyspora taberi TaxID=60895 RepID=A0ABN3VAR6_9PSEU